MKTKVIVDTWQTHPAFALKEGTLCVSIIEGQLCGWYEHITKPAPGDTNRERKKKKPQRNNKTQFS